MRSCVLAASVAFVLAGCGEGGECPSRTGSPETSADTSVPGDNPVAETPDTPEVVQPQVNAAVAAATDGTVWIVSDYNWIWTMSYRDGLEIVTALPEREPMRIVEADPYEFFSDCDSMTPDPYGMAVSAHGRAYCHTFEMTEDGGIRAIEYRDGVATIPAGVVLRRAPQNIVEQVERAMAQRPPASNAG